MKSITELSQVLEQRSRTLKYGKLQLARDSGVTYRTLSHVLGGAQDFKVSTLLAVADRLGLELMLVPKEARQAFVHDTAQKSAVPTKVQAALDRLKSGGA